MLSFAIAFQPTFFQHAVVVLNHCICIIVFISVDFTSWKEKIERDLKMLGCGSREPSPSHLPASGGKRFFIAFLSHVLDGISLLLRSYFCSGSVDWKYFADEITKYEILNLILLFFLLFCRLRRANSLYMSHCKLAVKPDSRVNSAIPAKGTIPDKSWITTTAFCWSTAALQILDALHD